MIVPGSANALLLATAAAEGGYQISRSVRFNSSDSAYLSRTPASAGNRKTWTWAGWVKRAKLGATQTFFMSAQDASNVTRIRFESDDTLRVHHYVGNSLVGYRQTTQVFRDVSAWYHIAWVVDTTAGAGADRIKLFVNGSQITAFASTTDPSQNADLFINSTNQHKISSELVGNFLDLYLADIHFIDGQALDPTSFTETDATTGQLIPKAYAGSYGTNGFHLPFSDNSTAAALGTDTSGNGNTWTVNNISAISLAGNYAAYVYASNATYDGTATGTSYYYGAGTNFNLFDGNTATLSGGEDVSGSWLYFRPGSSITSVTSLRVHSAYVQEIRVNGSVVTVSPTLPATASQWYTISSPPSTITEIAVKGSVSQSAVGRASAIEINGSILIDNSFASGNDSLVDTPTSYGTDTGAGGEVRGNYATLNPLSKGSAVTLSDGNLQHYSTDSSWAGPSVALTGFGMTAGKWYWECTISTHQFSYIGIAQIDKTHAYIGGNANSCGYLTSNGGFYGGGAQTANPATIYTANATLMFAYDADAKKFWVGQNGTWFSVGGNAGDPANGNYPSHNGFGSSGEIYTPATSTYNAVTTKYNFGQRPFAYTAPSGYKALCTTNLPSTTITTSGSYTGNGVADGPFVYLNGVPTAMTVNGNAVTFGTHADKLSNGFKIRTTSTTYNQNASTYNYSITSTGDPFKRARAQSNP